MCCLPRFSLSVGTKNGLKIFEDVSHPYCALDDLTCAATLLRCCTKMHIKRNMSDIFTRLGGAFFRQDSQSLRLFTRCQHFRDTGSRITRIQDLTLVDAGITKPVDLVWRIWPTGGFSVQRMTGVRTMSWYMAVAVLIVATFIGWKSALAANTVHYQAEFCRTHVEPLGYLCAEYRTYSADGYELVMHRVGRRPRQQLDVSQSQTDIPDRGATLSCGDVNQPFNSPRCLRLNSFSEDSELNSFSEERDRPKNETDELSHKRTRGKHHKGSSVPKRSPHSSGLRHHDSHHHGHHGHHRRNAIVTESFNVTSRNGADLPTAREGPSRERKRPESPGRVYSPPGISPSPRAATKTQTPPGQHASSSSPSLGQDQNSEKFITGMVPVLLMHQELVNGDSWFQSIDAGDRFLPLLLVDAGFDAWIGHERATYWSHGHRSLRADDKRYWDWTWDEHAKYDIPALLELINKVTGFAAHYVGISQSATVGAAAATRPEGSQFMRSLTLIGPPIYRGYTSSIVLNAWAFLFGNNIDQIYYSEGYQNGAFNYSRAFPVNYLSGQGPVGQALSTISGPNCCLGSTIVRFTNGWDGTTSFKNLIHYQQGVRTNFWRHFDYEDSDKNNQTYGSVTPPDYLPEEIPSHIPILVIYGGQDIYSPLAGMRSLLSRLGTNWDEIYMPDYAHYDLSYSVNRTQDVFIPILQFLEAHRWN